MNLHEHITTRIIKAIISIDGRYCKVFCETNGFIIIRYYSISYNTCHQITQLKQAQNAELMLWNNSLVLRNSPLIECGDILHLARKIILRAKLFTFLRAFFMTDTTQKCLQGNALEKAHHIDEYLIRLGHIDDLDIEHVVKSFLRREQSPSLKEMCTKLQALSRMAISMELEGTWYFISQVYEHIDHMRTS